MNDYAGIGFLILLAVGAVVGLRRLANPPRRTAEEFERSVSDSGASVLGALGNALHDHADPGRARARVVVSEMKEGRYQKKRREGKANDSVDGPASGHNIRERSRTT